MPLDDSQLSPSGQPVTNDQAQGPTSATANPPATPSSPSTPPSTPALGASDQQPQPFQSDDAQVSNAGPIAKRGVQDPNMVKLVDDSQHPLVQKASVMHSVARALAGNPRRVVIDADGSRREEPVPVTGKQLMVAIALEALQGSLAGLAAGRGRGPGSAGLAGMQSVMQRQQQDREHQEQEQQQQFKDRASALASKANLAELNARIGLNVAETEKIGSEMIDKQVELNRASGVLDTDPGNLENGGQPLTQSEILDGMRTGKFNIGSHIGAMAGRVPVTAQDGSTHWEATFLLVKNPNAPVTLSQEQWDRYASAHVPGFPASVKVGQNGMELKLSQVQRANEILAAHNLADYRLKDMRDVLEGTPYADKVPSSIDFSKPGVETALQRFQRYVSHSAMHGNDVYESLVQMGSDKRDPKTGAMQPNGDSKYVDQVAAAMGGWPLLQAVHNQLAANKKAAEEFNIVDSEAKANAVLASPNKFTRDQISSAKNFLTLSEQQGSRKAAEAARERAVAEGKDVEAMFKTGVNPITGEKLTLDNAPDSMLVDSKGRPVPQNLQSFYKPSQNERQTADTARQVLAISATLRAAVHKNPNLVGPLLGNSKSALSKLGFGDAESQKMLDDIAFLQSGATKMHTSRFSNEILKKMGNMIKPGMNTQQFTGALNSIDEVAGRYAKEDQLVTVADYKQMQQSPAGAAATPSLTNLQVNPTTGQQIGWNGKQWVDANTGKAVQ
jgi:hypothetical protein